MLGSLWSSISYSDHLQYDLLLHFILGLWVINTFRSSLLVAVHCCPKSAELIEVFIILAGIKDLYIHIKETDLKITPADEVHLTFKCLLVFDTNVHPFKF